MIASMLTPGTFTWGDAVPVVLVTVLVLFVPGGVSVLAARGRALTAMALGPAVTVTEITAGGVLASLAGVRWGAVPLALTTVAGWVVAAGLGWLVTRRHRRRRTRRDAPGVAAEASGAATASGAAEASPVQPSEGGGRWWEVVLGVLGVLAAFAVVARVMTRAQEVPTLFPQHPDTIFHLGLAQWMASTGDISFLHSNGFVYPGRTTGGYPVGFHDVTATLAMLTGVPVVVATSCAVLVMAGLVWPLGMLALARSILGRSPAVCLVAPFVAVLFTAYPYMIMGFGVLWPNLLGQALLPGVLTVTMAFPAWIRARRVPPGGLGLSALLLLAGLPGLTMAHPNATITWLLFATIAMLVALARSLPRARAGGARAVGLTLAAAVLAVLPLAYVFSRRVPSMMNTGNPGPELSTGQAWHDVLNLAPREARDLTLLAVLAVVGAVLVIVWRRSALWAVIAAVVMQALFWGNVAVDSPAWRAFTWPWYNNAVRLSVAAVLPLSLLVTAALAIPAVAAGRWVTRHRSSQPAGRAWTPTLVQVGTAGVLLAAVTVPPVAWAGTKVSWLRPYFHPGVARSWASVTEQDGLRALAAHIPPGAVTAENPWNGGSYLYIVSGRRLLWPTEKANTTPDRMLLGQRLDAAATDPAVCRAAQADGVQYALTGGVPFLWAKAEELQDYAGVDAIASGTAPGWSRVAQAGGYTLWKLTRCAG